MNKRKVLTMTFALVNIIATWAFGEKSIPENQFRYGSFSNGNCLVVGGSPDNEAGILDIPQYYRNDYGDYYSVVGIDEAAFAGNQDIKKVVDWVYQLPYYYSSLRIAVLEIANCSSVYTSIGRLAFKNCVNLTNIAFPKSLRSIGEKAFSGCVSLTSISIPSAVTTIGSQAFEGCNSLTLVTVNRKTPISISSDVFSNCGNMTLVVPAGCKEAYKSATVWKDFKEIKEMTYTTIHIPEGYNTRTFSCTEALDFSEVSNIKAYTFDSGHQKSYHFEGGEGDYGYYNYLTSINYGVLGFKRVYQVGAGQGILIKGQPGDYQIPNMVGDVIMQEDKNDSYLVGVPFDTTVSPEDGDYVNLALTSKKYNHSSLLSYYFCKLSHEGTISGGKAYLHLKKSLFHYYSDPTVYEYEVYGMAMSFGDEEGVHVTGIAQVKDKIVEINDRYYDLQGRRVDNPTKGIYIKNGKKVIVK